MAKDEWRRMLLANHARHYPTEWGYVVWSRRVECSEASRPGQTWATDRFAMQDFPVGNLHSRSQPLLVYLRLRGTEQSNAGTLHTPPAEQAARGNV